MQSVADNLTEKANEVQSLLQDLLLNHSSIYLWNVPDGSVAIIDVRGNYAYEELEEKGRQVQAHLLKRSNKT